MNGVVHAAKPSGEGDSGATASNPKKSSAEIAASNVAHLLKKREEKISGKSKKDKGQPALVEEDKEIMRMSKNKKRRERREKNTEKDDFDNMLEKYQGALEKRFKGTEGAEPADMSD
jgi:hypothetical protein